MTPDPAYNNSPYNNTSASSSIHTCYVPHQYIILHTIVEEPSTCPGIRHPRLAPVSSSMHHLPFLRTLPSDLKSCPTRTNYHAQATVRCPPSVSTTHAAGQATPNPPKPPNIYQK